MSREILFIGHRIPFPPDRGDKIRSHHILKRLARIAPVHVATFADDDADLGEEVELATLAHSYHLARRTRPLIVSGVQGVFGRRPISLSAFYDAGLAQYVARVLRARPIGTIFVFSGQMGQYVPRDFSGRVIVDLVDVDSAKFESYAEKGSGLMRRVNAREARLLAAEECRLARLADTTLLISREEAELFASRLPRGDRADVQIDVLRNGTDSAYFDPAVVLPEPGLEALPQPRLIFTGQMDYTPNIDAVTRAATRIMPLVRKAVPEATFHVVGRNPTHEVRALHGLAGTHIWGRVDDVRPWLKACDMAVVPLELARGVQNKVLEAMSMALPVVLTSGAATGIPASDGTHVAIADSDDEIARKLIRLATDEVSARAKGTAARRFIVDRMSWQSALAALPEIVAAPARARRNAA